MTTQTWSVLVEIDATNVSDEAHDHVLGALSEYAVNTTTVSNGNLGVILSVTATGVAEAAQIAVALVLAAAPADLSDHPAVGVEVVTEAEQERRAMDTAR
ncbi:hypothetical protein [Streptomyces sp. TLI_171]|uniref:hypothetical protein n=1 Tax=Streptomyces sp. TLI_171 TaxID=1938859 RepID=UPI000C17C63D|nr:hypothetical protein [Streptomyces sp. TLI_171]RKE03004.1 hypothetical protein BX266_7611 [Streptomyces sp. TLI_171]